MNIVVHRLQQREWQVLRSLRIRALSESPDAFRPTAAQARMRTDDDWRTSATRFATSETAAMFLARIEGPAVDGAASAAADGSDVVGLGSASIGTDAVGHVGAMWVDPRVRGQHAGAQIFDTAVDFLWRRGCRTIVLEVTEGNALAIALYQSRSFVFTGHREPLREHSRLRELEMRLDRPASQDLT